MIQSVAVTQEESQRVPELYLDCIHCGLCLPQCPTYRELGMEADSPRGRIYLIRAVEEGTLTWTPRAAEHLDLCLGCRACETACPAGVHFGRMLEDARAAIEQALPRPLAERWLRRFVFAYLFTSPARLHIAFRLLRFYQQSGLRWLGRRTGLTRSLAPKIYELEELLPDVPASGPGVRTGQTYAPYGERRYRVAFFVGCVMNELMGEIQRATIEVLRHNGCEVIIPQGQGCCGALHSHSGERELTLDLIERNAGAFAGLKVDSIITNAAGCGATLKEYGDLAAERKAVAAAAREMALKVEDVSQFLGRIGARKPVGRIEKRVAYDDPCHLVHGQKISREPRLLLQSIPGIQWCELPNADQCCGSAGTYNVTHFDMSMQVLEKKMQSIARIHPDVVATGNPGCILQLRYGAKRFGVPVEVRHPVELLAQSYAG